MAVKHWKIRQPIIKYDKEDTLTNKILKIRGIEDIYTFLNPSDMDINDPFTLKNMKEAVDIIIESVNNFDKIGIYADIDCDGVTSAAELYNYLLNFTDNIELISHQRKENHGLKTKYITQDIDLIIVVDSSTNSVEECKELYEKNKKIVILDHHEQDTINPYAVIVNPQICSYPNKSLSGAGVVFQTCRAIDSVMNTDYAYNYIDLACVGMLGDMMNVTQKETRAIISTGLAQIHTKEGNKGLIAILKHLKKEYKPNAMTISFYLAPFINSVIRLNKIELILQILTTTDESKLKSLIKECGTMNSKRKELQSDILEELERNLDVNHKIIIAITDGIIATSTLNGLIANQIANKYQKPTLVVSTNKDGMFAGSGRSYGKLDFRKVLLQTELFDSVEGHNHAFGVEFNPNLIIDIHHKLDKELENLSQDYQIEADLKLDIEDITWDIAYEMQDLGFISGEGFKDPSFIVENIIINPEDVKVMNDIHVKFMADEIEFVKFNVSQQEIENIKNSTCVDVLGTLSVNSWYNFGKKETIRTKQIMINDIECYSF